MHRRRVYTDFSSSRKAQSEGWLSISIYVSAVILLFSLLGCLPDMISSTLGWLLPERVSYRLGVGSGTTSSLALFWEALMAISGAYLVLALFVKSHPRH
jgi:hypothetical protein